MSVALPTATVPVRHRLRDRVARRIYGLALRDWRHGYIGDTTCPLCAIPDEVIGDIDLTGPCCPGASCPLPHHIGMRLLETALRFRGRRGYADIKRRVWTLYRDDYVIPGPPWRQEPDDPCAWVCDSATQQGVDEYYGFGMGSN